ncbi:rifamycin-inactivating phosphotransferase [Nonomuraea sp. NPDC049309]|uniref:rifamycin-inactivating phosphotransferase n=1 Tax=Nonomuraea sp. NPDC049309 TaxID=3364350 RepID=UPI00371F80DC
MRYVLGFDQAGATDAARTGGKGANLAELSRAGGVRVPGGFCVTTDAYQRVVAGAIGPLLDRLDGAGPGDRAAIAALSAEVREAVEGLEIPDDVAAEIAAALARLGETAPCAVRSSATAEDLPTASFAGQQDSYLNVAGLPEILRHVLRCWASLFTERAITYRVRNGFGHRQVRMAVVVQRMIFPDAAGVLFTADPVTSNRKVAQVEAVWGLGDALVSGQVTADVYTVGDDRVLSSEIAAKTSAVQASPDGGIEHVPIEPERRNLPVLTDEQAVRLARLGRRIEAHFGRPQDIEWCLTGDELYVVQSRPITTLFPIPEAGDDGHHVYLSVGHQQMMTDAMRPLGLSFWQLTTPRPMTEAGGRLFVDCTPLLSTRSGRAALLNAMRTADPLFRDALETVLERDFVPLKEDDGAPLPQHLAPRGEPLPADPAIVTELIRRNAGSVAKLRREIAGLSGTALIDFIQDDLAELRRLLFDPRSGQVIAAGMDAAVWLNEHLGEWLGEKNAANVLSQSVPHNVTSEMGLALLDVADTIRPHAEVVAFLDRVAAEGRRGAGFLDELAGLPGGTEARDAIRGYLDAYGMRCAGEIDITRTRWGENPAELLPTLLGNVRNFPPGAGKQRFERGLEEARRKERDVLARLRALPGGERKAEETKQMIDRVRTFTGYREYPKFGMISRYFVYKQALLGEAERLVAAGALREPSDVYYLRFDELREVVATGRADAALIAGRREEFRACQALTPPRVITSDGETLTGRYRRADLPPGALPGMPVSAGTVEGRARVVTDMAEARLETGDILVTAYTDPSWTPLFVAAAGLVTEVGGLMTHGAVVAREYGLPAVVAVDRATRLIRDGRRIRVHGSDGYVELLD